MIVKNKFYLDPFFLLKNIFCDLGTKNSLFHFNNTCLRD